ncbi:uncharacterized protein SCHCODRAFT_02570852 [Schizophyllum commune H4-8]|uniref:uncharacterized protein n=1 Tax=Schizophyllum commune (strain H4-8 / FGSC 9210) TaxID=578458 RepID=UPI00215EE94E|nr:uncharacterized protein SCHCODRAFT_02570852 [Schizophyllum commune H4-8]KAI5897242.1 hypothetical protein SCHCODRAFT_02570852 [Schizophyllum commune H4-8]
MPRNSTSAIPLGSISSPGVVKESATLRAILNDCGRLVNIQALRSGDACSPSDPGLGSSVAGFATAIERQVDILQPMLIELSELLHRAEHQKQLNNAILSPVRRLPNEILAEIFLFYVVHDSPRFPRIRPDFTFSRVCHRWRAVALGTTALWTSISLWPSEPAEAHDTLVRELELAGDRPLDVRFVHQWPCAENADKPTKSWEHLQTLSYRWRTLRLELNSSYFRVMTPRPVVCSSLVALYLKHEVLEPDQVPGSDDKGHLLTALSYAPMLRTVDIQVRRVRGGSSPLRFPNSWRLTDLAIFADHSDGSVARFVPLLEQNANTLKRLSLSLPHFGGTFYMTPDVLPVVSMPQLTELTCRMKAMELVSSIDAPQLSSLTIDRDLRKADDHPTHGLSVAHRIGTYTKLTQLSVLEVKWPTPSLLATLRALPNLSYLRLEETKPGKLITKALVDAMTRGEVDVDGALTPPNASCPLPNLAHMHMVIQNWETKSKDLEPAVRKMALSRAATAPQHLVAFFSSYKM